MLERLKHIIKIPDTGLRSLQDFLSLDKTWIKLVSIAVFLLSLNWFYSYVGIYERIPERPCSIHSSAQCQRASISQNYYNIDMNFFKPRINVFLKSNGITGVEFPIIYYTAAITYKLFGFNDAYLKTINLILVTLGIFFFFRMSQLFLKNTVLSLLLVCSAIVSPVLLYYSANVSPDTPAFAFVLCAWYFFFRYLSSNKNSHLNLFVFFGALGALIKIISVMCFLVVFCLLILDQLKFFKKDDRLFLISGKRKVIIRSIIGILVVISWYVYAKLIYTIYGNPPFAMEAMMVTDMDTLRDVIKYAKNWIFHYYSTETYTFLVCAIVLILFNLKRANRLLLTITGIYILGSLAYVFLFLRQFMHHDYYIIAMLPCVFFLLLVFFDIINKFSLRYSLLINVVFVIVIFFNVKESIEKCREIYAERFNAKEYLGGNFRSYYDLGPRLRSMGIKWEDKFVSAFDNSFSNSLYFMNQAGFQIPEDANRETIEGTLKLPDVKYLVLNDSAKFNKIYPNNFAKQIILYHRGLIIYKLK